MSAASIPAQSTSKTDRRHRNVPTYQSSARQMVLDQQQQLLALSSSSLNSVNSNSIGSSRKLKSCLKKSKTYTSEVQHHGISDDSSSMTSSALEHSLTVPNNETIEDQLKELQQQPQQASPTTVTAKFIDALPLLDSTTKSVASTERLVNALPMLHTHHMQQPQQPIKTSVGSNHTNEYDHWSHTSDMSVSTTMQLSTNGTSTTTTSATTASLPLSSPIVTDGMNSSSQSTITNSTTIIPDAQQQRKLDLQHHDALLKYAAATHHSSILESATSTFYHNHIPKEEEQQQKRHRFFGLRKKKIGR
jgi:hypothetical protein